MPGQKACRHARTRTSKVFYQRCHVLTVDIVSVLAITRNGITIGKRLKSAFPGWDVLAPAKLSDGTKNVTWYAEPTGEKIAGLFKSTGALVCIFSLGAVIRLVAPHLESKKTDPAIIVIDDKAEHVISVLSGHLGGANELTTEIASKLGSTAVITTAADVNKTIAVDLVGRKFGWKIEDDSSVTSVSACMVNQEKIGVFQDAGRTDWYDRLPDNVRFYDSMEEMKSSGSAGFLIITDRILDMELENSVVYRPPSLVIGVGLHRNTTKQTILDGIADCLRRSGLAPGSVAMLASVKKDPDVRGLIEAAEELGADISYAAREELAGIEAPNPSETVRAFEGTASVSEAAAIRASRGRLVMEKQKFPPDLTIAIARKA